MAPEPTASTSKAQEDPLNINKRSKPHDKDDSSKPDNKDDGAPQKKPRRKPLPKPTTTVQQRSGLNLDANQGRTMMVQSTRGAGWHCTLCNVLCKDSARWLDHINGRHHLRRMGQTTQVSRVTLQDVRNKLDALRAHLALPDANGTRKLLSRSQRYDFEKRIQAIADSYANEQRKRRHVRRQAKEQKRMEAQKAKQETEDQDALAILGFGSFGSTKR